MSGENDRRKLATAPARSTFAAMQLWIGTSGFQYPEWKGSFYPQDLAVSRMLQFYAEQFPTTEINSSFLRVPSPKSIARWAAATPEQFRFSFKAPQKVTHFAKLRDCAETVAFFHGVIATMHDKLGAVLFQLPATFTKDAPLLRAFLASLPPGLRAAFEFRHVSWFDEDVFEALRQRNAALCIAESEELTTPSVATADFGYLRLRREDYRPARLARWADFVREQGQWKDTYVYFKHEESGIGPKFARKFRALIDA